jgi:hypothetical protein
MNISIRIYVYMSIYELNIINNIAMIECWDVDTYDTPVRTYIYFYLEILMYI